MKAIIYSALFICLTGFINDKMVNTDYRNNYEGSYICKRTHTHLNANGNALVEDVSIYTISIHKDNSDSSLKIITNEGDLIVKLLPPDLSGNKIYGKFFATDSIFITFKYGRGPISYSYKGKKN